MKIKNILILLILFITINTVVFILTKINTDDRVEIALKKDLDTLQTHFDILNTSQKNISYAISQSILRNTDLVKFLSQSYSATQEENNINRVKLYNQLKEQYRTAKRQGVLQIQFVNKDNISFLRVHKPLKFGDDLTTVRKDYKIVNKTKKPIRGFTQSRTAHGFRNSFPVFDKEKNHIGAMEISFSSHQYQWYLNKVSKIHSHFLVDKTIFDAKTWQIENLVIKYNQSGESKDLMLALTDAHSKQRCIINNKVKLEPFQELIDNKIKIGDKFNFYVNYKGDIQIVSFLPIKNLSKKSVAWIVSYTNSEIIKSSLKSQLIVRFYSFAFSILIIYLLFKQIISNFRIKQEKEKLEEQRTLFNEILNTTDNIMLITDLKDVKFSNDKFKSMLMISGNKEYNEETNHNLLELFIESDGYLHSGLLDKDETFASLYKRTRITNRKVLVLNQEFEPKAYAITMQRLIKNGDYLINLSDISKMQEEFKKIENKAYVDGLTQVYNRNKFNELFEKELKRIKRYKEPLSIAMIDIDKFKNFNDTYGHLIGDEVLVQMAQTVNSNVRETDEFARWGGEEFVILFIDTPLDKAKVVAEYVKDKIEENRHTTAGKITASFGVTQYQDGDTIDTILKRCDDALYKAKENGRNRVEII